MSDAFRMPRPSWIHRNRSRRQGPRQPEPTSINSHDSTGTGRTTSARPASLYADTTGCSAGCREPGSITRMLPTALHNRAGPCVGVLIGE